VSMSEHRQTEHVEHASHRAPVVRRDGDPASEALALSPVTALQRQAGNRAVVGLLTANPSSVQREPFGARQPKEQPNRLHLDPEIEAQIQAITAMNALIAPTPVQAALLDLNLPQMPLAPGQPGTTAPALTPPAPPPATATGPAPGTGLMGPRAGTGGDMWKAVMAEPALGPAITALGDQAAGRAKSQWDKLSTGGAVAVVTGSVAVGGGAIAGILSNPDARKWITSTLNDKIIPVPKVPGLAVQLNLSGENVIVGLHLDVGQILPAALGFGPASATTPLGTPFP